ncbi:MAG TPA: hypothetical protein P5114_03180, partial [Hyphomicrobiaceae bacterium]|nr:hypothetical protein [Hyphomicrobiaceae bacterium]
MSDPNSPYDPDDENAPLKSEDEVYSEQERKRREAEADMEVQILDAVRGSGSGPVQPVRLTNDNSFCFSCHKGISCWN